MHIVVYTPIKSILVTIKVNILSVIKKINLKVKIKQQVSIGKQYIVYTYTLNSELFK